VSGRPESAVASGRPESEAAPSALVVPPSATARGKPPRTPTHALTATPVNARAGNQTLFGATTPSCSHAPSSPSIPASIGESESLEVGDQVGNLRRREQSGVAVRAAGAGLARVGIG